MQSGTYTDNNDDTKVLKTNNNVNAVDIWVISLMISTRELMIRVIMVLKQMITILWIKTYGEIILF